eukprot:TRINITY_DN22706_c2_g1_i1.p1 TRINITY_DN22706_c2_g1~~TRINITY_DN22706_c2_g1_i1.p1  ORF type:complete len:269 (-),score=43.95 TRINITY_DN22706_c2_g1_i1:20-826(-)
MMGPEMYRDASAGEVQLLRITAADLGVKADQAPETKKPTDSEGSPTLAERREATDANNTEEMRAMAESFWGMGSVKGAVGSMKSSWEAFASTMDDLFLEGGAKAERAKAANEAPNPSAQGQPVPPAAPAMPQRPTHQDVPMIFRLPSNEEVQELLECEGLPAYIAVPNKGFIPKRLCVDSGGPVSLYVIEPDSGVPSMFYGMNGFALEELRRVVVGASHPGMKPLMSLEFQTGFLPVRLGDPIVLRGLVGFLCSERNDIEVVQRPDWV